MLINFSHANGIPTASYQPLFESLAPHQVIFNPQYGHNPLFPFTDGWTHLADELLHFLDQHAREPVVAVGHSMGAVLSFIAACKSPQHFKGVLMLDPPLLWGKMAWGFRFAKLIGRGDDITPAGKSKFRKREWPDRQTAIDYFASKSLFKFEPACFDAFCQAALSPKAQQPGESEAVELAFSVDVEVGIFRNTPTNLKTYSRPKNLPMKVIYGEQSDASRADCIEPFCRHFGIECQLISGRHMYPLQQPEQTVELIQEFISRL
ncbi:MAG: alpha/beta hydrolase [Pseudomonadota bacterium]|nr:alpha/beta hydrolase [Pseudomonadota bacterium]